MSIRNIISHSLRVAWKDLMELIRNRLGLVMLVLMPVFMMGMVGFIYPSDASLPKMSVALVNGDEGYMGFPSASEPFIIALEIVNNSADMMTLIEAGSFDQVTEMIQLGDVEGGIIIASNFSESFWTRKQGGITIVTDQSNPQMATMLNAVLTNIIDQIGREFAQQNLQQSLGVNASDSLAMVEPYNVQVEGAIEGNFSYFDFVAPGIMAMTVMMSVMTGLPAAISHEKEVGTLDGMMVAPINRLAIILGKTLAQMSRGMLQGTLVLILGVVLFGVTIHGNIFLVFGLLLLGVFSFVGFGVVITSFTKDQETAMMVMMSLTFPMMFLSGIFFPIEQMPWFMQSLSKMLPLTYVADALRKVMVLGADVTMITTELSILIGFGVVMTAIAVPVFKRAMTR